MRGERVRCACGARAVRIRRHGPRAQKRRRPRCARRWRRARARGAEPSGSARLSSAGAATRAVVGDQAARAAEITGDHKRQQTCSISPTLTSRVSGAARSARSHAPSAAQTSRPPTSSCVGKHAEGRPFGAPRSSDEGHVLSDGGRTDLREERECAPVGVRADADRALVGVPVVGGVPVKHAAAAARAAWPRGRSCARSGAIVVAGRLSSRSLVMGSSTSPAK